MKTKRLAPERAQDVAARARTLASQVLKEKVGSVRSQAAARYEVSPAEIVAAAKVPSAADRGSRSTKTRWPSAWPRPPTSRT